MCISVNDLDRKGEDGGVCVPRVGGNSDIDDQVDRYIRDQRDATIVMDPPLPAQQTLTSTPPAPLSPNHINITRTIALQHRSFAIIGNAGPPPTTQDSDTATLSRTTPFNHHSQPSPATSSTHTYFPASTPTPAHRTEGPHHRTDTLATATTNSVHPLRRHPSWKTPATTTVPTSVTREFPMAPKTPSLAALHEPTLTYISRTPTHLAPAPWQPPPSTSAWPPMTPTQALFTPTPPTRPTTTPHNTGPRSHNHPHPHPTPLPRRRSRRDN